MFMSVEEAGWRCARCRTQQPPWREEDKCISCVHLAVFKLFRQERVIQSVGIFEDLETLYKRILWDGDDKAKSIIDSALILGANIDKELIQIAMKGEK